MAVQQETLEKELQIFHPNSVNASDLEYLSFVHFVRKSPFETDKAVVDDGDEGIAFHVTGLVRAVHTDVYSGIAIGFFPSGYELIDMPATEQMSDIVQHAQIQSDFASVPRTYFSSKEPSIELDAAARFQKLLEACSAYSHGLFPRIVQNNQLVTGKLIVGEGDYDRALYDRILSEPDLNRDVLIKSCDNALANYLPFEGTQLWQSFHEPIPCYETSICPCEKVQPTW